MRLFSSVAARTRLRALAGIFFAYHCLAVAMMSYPFSKYSGQWPQAPFEDYVSYTQQRQRWTMFIVQDPWALVVPTIHYWVGSQQRTVGAMMPGFQTGLGGVRMRAFWQRMYLNDRWTPYYLPQLCKDLEKQFHEKPTRIEVDIKLHVIRDVRRIVAGERPIEIQSKKKSHDCGATR